MEHSEMQAARKVGDRQTWTWYVDHEYTHGVPGLAAVDCDGPHRNRSGIGPDMILEGLTREELAGALRGMGFNDLATDDDDLYEAWKATK